ncbi:MAG: aminopeptidase N [Proteobacteria bacterium]|nr:aminopeptidase N [Pseudomonadota bacterium]
MQQPETKYLKDYKRPAYKVETIDLTVELFDQYASVTSEMKVTRDASADITTPFEMDGKDLELVSLELDNRLLSADDYQLTAESLKLANLPVTFSLAIKTRIVPHTNTSLEGFYKAGASFLTQCEAEGFRRITFFPDRPDVMSIYTCTLIADKTRYPVLLSNGNLVKTGELDDNRHFATWHDPFRKPSYLFAMVAGNFVCVEDIYTTSFGKEVALKFYTEKENADKCDHAIRSLQKAMKWDEDVFGLVYDLDIYMVVATSEFNMGAMENKGLNIFNSKFVLAKQETATDIDFQDIERVIAHEYFHNWTGNRVTVCNWFQLSLKEGLTVFRDQEFSSDMGSRAIKRISDVRVLRAAQFAEDEGPMAHPVRPESYIEMNNFYTVTVYNKGAEVIRMIHTILGYDHFRNGMDLYFERHDGKAVTIEDFAAAMEDASGVDLTQFRLWYSQAGTPRISVERSYNKEKEEYALTITQSLPDTPGQAHKRPMLIPMKLALLSKEGRELPLTLLNDDSKNSGTTERVISLTKESETFTFAGMDKEPVPSLFRGFSAPVRVDEGYTDSERIFLLANDSDAFNRWDASQKLFTEHILMMVKQIGDRKPFGVSGELTDAIRKTLLHPELDRALIAQILTVPTETELGDQMKTIAVDGIHDAREFFIKTLGERLYDDLKDVYDRLEETGEYTIDGDSIARRSLKNKALFYLSKTEKGRSLVIDAFSKASNMTDEISALTFLADMNVPEREQAIDRFYEKWRKDTLVLDKWFSVQAGSQMPGTLDQVKRLMNHEAFSIKNPNKVRSLMGMFCMSNPFYFHASHGEGYQFLADIVIELDSINPSMAARLSAGFNKWNRYDENRKQQMKKELERIKATPSLSKGVYEIVTRALKG